MTNSAFAQPSPDAVLDRLMQFARAAGKPFDVPSPGHAGPPADQPSPSQAQSAPRSAAQREASRRNGSKSRGPVTREGKARAVLNGRKHGIFARLVRPDDDGREQSRLFDDSHDRLRNQLPLRTLETDLLVDQAAHLIVQLSRAMAITTRLTLGTIPTYADEAIKLRSLRADVDMANELAGSTLSLPDRPGSPPSPAGIDCFLGLALDARRTLAWSIREARREEHHRRTIADPALRPQPRGPDEWPPKVSLGSAMLRRIARQIRPIKPLLADVKELRATISCQRVVPAQHTDAWMALKSFIVPVAEAKLEQLDQRLVEIEEHDLRTTRDLLMSFEQIERVQGYESRIRRDLHRILDRLALLNGYEVPTATREPR